MKVVDIERVVILMRFIQYGWDEERKKSFDDNLRMMLETQCEDLEEYNKKIRAEVIEFISDKLIYPLLDECDRGLWEHISHIELAEEWVKVLNDNPYPKVKNYRESRKRDLRKRIAEKLKEQKNDIK